MIKKNILVFFLLAISTLLQAQNIHVLLNQDGSFKSLISTAQKELSSTDERSIKDALIVADILAKANLSRYISEDISSHEELRVNSTKEKDVEVFLSDIKSSSNMLLKGFSTIDQVVDKTNKFVSVTIGISHKNMQLVNKAAYVFGKTTTPPPQSRPLEAHLKSLKLLDGVKVLSFMGKYYIISLSTIKIMNPTPRMKIQALKTAKILAFDYLKNFILGEKINAKSTLTTKATTTYSRINNKITESSNEKLSEDESRLKKVAIKSTGFNRFWYIDNGKMFYYLYLEIPNN